MADRSAPLPLPNRAAAPKPRAISRSSRRAGTAARTGSLDRPARSSPQVKVRVVDEADDIFVKLMVGVVEPRRAFIRDEAPSLANFDG